MSAQTLQGALKCAVIIFFWVEEGAGSGFLRYTAWARIGNNADTS